jgi:hypothetical protein
MSEKHLPRLSEIPVPDTIRVDRDWPEQLREMADYIGAPAALRFAQAYGGLDEYIPAKLPADHKLRLVLGDHPAEALSAAYGNNRIVVPVGRRVLEKLRRGHVLHKINTGEISKREAARLLEVPYRVVLRWLAAGEGSEATPGTHQNPPPQKNQMDLFLPSLL